MHTQPPPLGGDTAYVHPSFYQALNANSHPPLPMGAPMPDQFPAGPVFQFPPHPPPMSSQHPAHPSVEMPFMHTVPAPTYGADPVFQSFFGLMDPHAGDVQDMDFSNLRAYGKSFQPSHEGWDHLYAPPSAGLDGYATSTSASYFTGSSSDDASTRFSSSDASSMRFGHPRHPSSSGNSAHPGVGSSRNPSIAWSQHLRMGSHQSAEHGNMHHPAMSVTMPPPAQLNQQLSMEPAPNFDAIHPGSHAPGSLLPLHLEDVSEEEPMDSVKAESTGSVGMTCASRSPLTDDLSARSGSDEPCLSPTGTAMRRPSSTTSSLAARRHRRPAALGLHTFRSSSHSAVGPQSPRSAGLAMPNDPHLRRIKSSTGVLSGRIQKSAASSAPRSPMHFSEAAPSPNPLSRHISASSALASESQDDHAGVGQDPLTPLSPPPYSAPPSSLPSATMPMTEVGNEMLENIWNYMPNTSTSTVFSFTPGPPRESGFHYSSPPQTPMETSQFANMRIRNNSGPHFFPVGPDSASGWTTAFAQSDAMAIDSVARPPTGQQPSAMKQSPGFSGPPSGSETNPALMASLGRPSLPQVPEATPYPPTMIFGAPAIHASADLPSGHSRHPFAGPPHGQPAPSQHAMPIQQPAAPPTHYPSSSMDTSMPPPPQPTVPSTTPREKALAVQEFVPRELAEPSALPPRLTPSSARSSKNYQFNNSFSHDYDPPP